MIFVPVPDRTPLLILGASRANSATLTVVAAVVSARVVCFTASSLIQKAVMKLRGRPLMLRTNTIRKGIITKC